MNYRERSGRRAHGVQRATGFRSLLNLVYTQPTKAVWNLLEAAVQICTVGVNKRRSLQVALYGTVNIFEWYNGRTPGV